MPLVSLSNQKQRHVLSLGSNLSLPFLLLCKINYVGETENFRIPVLIPYHMYKGYYSNPMS